MGTPTNPWGIFRPLIRHLSLDNRYGKAVGVGTYVKIGPGAYVSPGVGENTGVSGGLYVGEGVGAVGVKEGVGVAAVGVKVGGTTMPGVYVGSMGWAKSFISSASR